MVSAGSSPASRFLLQIIIFINFIFIFYFLIPDWGEGDIGGEEEEKADEGQEGYNQRRQIKSWKYEREMAINLLTNPDVSAGDRLSLKWVHAVAIKLLN